MSWSRPGDPGPRRWLAVLLLLGSMARAGEEEPAIYEVEVEFEGNDEVSSGQLARALTALRADLRRQGVDEGSAEDAAYELQRFYEAQGYRRARVLADFSRKDQEFTLRFRIEEGPRSFLEGMSFTGHTHFKASDLEECFTWLRSGVLGFAKTVVGRPFFTEAVYSEGLACVVTRYQLEGFYFARALPELEEDDLANVRLHLRVEEGPRILVVEAPRVLGVRAFDEAEVQAALDLRGRQLFVPRLPLILKGKVLDFYRNRGYRFAAVEVEREIDREKGEAKITLRVDEGPLTRIAGVTLRGNERTWDWVLRNRIRLRPEDLYSEEKVRQSYRSLLRSGLFSSVSMETAPVEGAGDRVNLDVGVVEKSKYKLDLLAGYGSYELLRGAVVLENINVFGTGHRFRLEGKGSFKGEGASGEYLNPFFFNEDLSHKVESFYERRENPSFVERQVGAENAFSYRITENVRSTLSHRLRESTVLDADPDVPPELIEDVVISTVGLSNVFDFRNSIVDPDRGSTHRVTMEYAGNLVGSEIDFLRLILSTSWVFPLGAGFRVVGSARAGVIQPLADTDVIPLQERFFSGGESTVRSFEEDAAGPTVNGEPIGGEAFTTYNVELRFPLFVLEDLQGAIFGDVGSLTEDIDDFGGGRYFFGIGSGVRYKTPVGPFRLDAAYNPDRQAGEDSFEIHISLGYPF